MKVAPLIHCRTYKCDYNAGFLARPNDFFDEEIQKARNYVVHATASIDSMKGNRWMVVNIGTHCIAGYIGYISDLAEQLNDEDLKIYSCDEQGRRIFAFIGFAVQEKNFNRTNDALQVTSKQLGDWLKAYLSKKWEKTVVDSQLTSYDSELSPCDEVDEDLGRSETIQNYIFYESNPYYDEKRFQYYLKQALRGDNVRFCSNLDRLRDVENTIFTTVTTSVNVIRQMKEQLSEREHKRSSKSQVISDGETESKKKTFQSQEEFCQNLENCLGRWLYDYLTTHNYYDNQGHTVSLKLDQIKRDKHKLLKVRDPFISMTIYISRAMTIYISRGDDDA